jgi:hypothetical protein
VLLWHLPGRIEENHEKLQVCRYLSTVWDYELKDAENGRNSKQGTLLYVCTFFYV